MCDIRCFDTGTRVCQSLSLKGDVSLRLLFLVSDSKSRVPEVVLIVSTDPFFPRVRPFCEGCLN